MSKQRKFHIPPVITLLLIILCIAAFAWFTKWYYTPIPYGDSIPVYLDQNQETTVELDWTLHRSYFGATRVDGTVLLDGKTYQGFNRLQWSWEKLWMKFRGEWDIPGFVGEPLGTLDNLLYVMEFSRAEDGTVDRIWLLEHRKGSESRTWMDEATCKEWNRWTPE